MERVGERSGGDRNDVAGEKGGSPMFFVPVMWAGYEVACMTPSGRAAIGVTHDRIGRLFGRAGTEWRILYEWPVERLSHTEVLTYLGERAEPDAPEGLVTLVTALDQSRPRQSGR